MNLDISLIKFGFPETMSNADIVRSIRNKMLAESDWAVLSDVPTDKESWILYRQSLRDLMQNYDGGDFVVFPNKPF